MEREADAVSPVPYGQADHAADSPFRLESIDEVPPPEGQEGVCPKTAFRGR